MSNERPFFICDECRSVEADGCLAVPGSTKCELRVWIDKQRAIGVLRELLKLKCFTCDCGVPDELFARAAEIVAEQEALL